MNEINDINIPEEHSDENEQIETIKQKSFSRNLDMYTKSPAFKFMLVFGTVFMSFIFIFQVWLTPIKVVGSSMQPTINASIKNEIDQSHCDIVYYDDKSHYDNDDIVIVKNNNYKYIPYIEQKDENGKIIAKQDVEYFIKRVIACPGQTITFYYKNQIPALLPKEYYYDIIVKDEDGEIVDLDDSYLTEDMKFTATEIVERSNDFPFFAAIFEKIADWQNLNDNERTFSITIPDDTYFVLGDNRNNSEDSRYFGVVSIKDIEGSVKLHLPHGKNIFQAIWIKLKSFI